MKYPNNVGPGLTTRKQYKRVSCLHAWVRVRPLDKFYMSENLPTKLCNFLYYFFLFIGRLMAIPEQYVWNDPILRITGTTESSDLILPRDVSFKNGRQVFFILGNAILRCYNIFDSCLSLFSDCRMMKYQAVEPFGLAILESIWNDFFTWLLLSANLSQDKRKLISDF